MVPKNNNSWMIENAVAGYTNLDTGKGMQLQVRALQVMRCASLSGCHGDRPLLCCQGAHDARRDCC